ncbi:unnamed protein product [Ectocarpus sp. 6 AP-2014]
MEPITGFQGLMAAGGAGVPPGGVAAATGAPHQMIPTVSGDSGEDSVSNDGKRKTEMAKERNRLHARNTRARKKQYMEELKDKVESLHTKRASAAHSKEATARGEEEQIARWAATLKKVLDLRCEGVVDEAAWNEVLTEDFELSLPLTPYRKFDPADVEGGRRRVLVGVEGMISDTASLTEMCENLAERCRQRGGLSPPAVPAAASGSGGDNQPPRPRVHLKSCVSSGDLVFSSDQGIMCVFSMTTVDACDFGSPLEVEKNGMLRAAFVEGGKLDELEMMFDGIAVHQQLQKAMG